MSIEDVLNEMRGFADKGMVSVVCSDIMIEWADAIEAAMREPAAEVAEDRYSTPPGENDEITALLPVGTKLYALPLDAAGEIERLRELVESAYRDGWQDGCWRDPFENLELLDDWEQSATKAALAGKDPRD